MRQSLRRIWHALPIFLGMAAMVHPIAKLFARWDWRMDLITHFQEVALGLSLLAAASLAFRFRRLAIVMLVMAILQVEPVFRYEFAWDRDRVDAGRPPLRILFANVLYTNMDSSALVSLIRETDPDIVGLAEFTEEWQHGLAEIAKTYPYRKEIPNGPQGLALWFKKPPIQIDPQKSPCLDGWPYIHATFEFDGVVRNLWLLHPSSPFRRIQGGGGFPELVALADQIRAQPGSTIVVGDLNTTDGSPYFEDFLATTRLHDSRRGFGRQPTWPVGIPYQITIDHALISEDLVVANRFLGTTIHSDHRPIVVDLRASSTTAASAGAN